MSYIQLMPTCGRVAIDGGMTFMVMSPSFVATRAVFSAVASLCQCCCRVVAARMGRGWLPVCLPV